MANKHESESGAAVAGAAPCTAACNIYIEWNNYAIRCTGEATLEEMDAKIAEAYAALKKGLDSETDGKIEMPPNKD